MIRGGPVGATHDARRALLCVGRHSRPPRYLNRDENRDLDKSYKKIDRFEESRYPTVINSPTRWHIIKISDSVISTN